MTSHKTRSRTFDDAAPGSMIPDLLPVARVGEAQVDGGVPPGHGPVLGLAVNAAGGGGHPENLDRAIHADVSNSDALSGAPVRAGFSAYV
jgi:hypothetical protein